MELVIWDFKSNERHSLEEKIKESLFLIVNTFLKFLLRERLMELANVLVSVLFRVNYNSQLFLQNVNPLLVLNVLRVIESKFSNKILHSEFVAIVHLLFKITKSLAT